MNKERLMHILLSPVVTEKTTRQADLNKQVCFKVARDAKKHEIAEAVSTLFEVEVSNVRVVNVKGKTKRTRHGLGRRQDWRKAYVHLKPGQDIDFGGAA